jgi:hypothetical protein
MVVDVDEPGGDSQAGGVDRPGRRGIGQRTDLLDAVLLQGEVGLEGGAACAIDDRGVTNDQIEQRIPPRHQQSSPVSRGETGLRLRMNLTGARR